ncbi:MAG: hypothetical protein JSW51_11640 [Gemmatimonadota bacterium]|nr:MAG: hypothetical protein JSW51_11640 [Gemmatimonadota bacterium]
MYSRLHVAEGMIAPVAQVGKGKGEKGKGKGKGKGKRAKTCKGAAFSVQREGGGHMGRGKKKRGK